MTFEIYRNGFGRNLEIDFWETSGDVYAGIDLLPLSCSKTETGKSLDEYDMVFSINAFYGVDDVNKKVKSEIQRAVNAFIAKDGEAYFSALEFQNDAYNLAELLNQEGIDFSDYIDDDKICQIIDKLEELLFAEISNVLINLGFELE